jgi:hypothetical protein
VRGNRVILVWGLGRAWGDRKDGRRRGAEGRRRDGTGAVLRRGKWRKGSGGLASGGPKDAIYRERREREGRSAGERRRRLR